jgi:hypothetical protein
MSEFIYDDGRHVRHHDIVTLTVTGVLLDGAETGEFRFYSTALEGVFLEIDKARDAVFHGAIKFKSEGPGLYRDF